MGGEGQQSSRAGVEKVEVASRDCVAVNHGYCMKGSGRKGVRRGRGRTASIQGMGKTKKTGVGTGLLSTMDKKGSGMRGVRGG